MCVAIKKVWQMELHLDIAECLERNPNETTCIETPHLEEGYLFIANDTQQHGSKVEK